MMTLNNRTGNRKRFDAVRIDRTLCQPFHIFNLMGLFIEHFNKSLAYDLTLFLRLRYTCQFCKELSTGIHTDNIQTETFIIVQYILELVLTQHAVIYKDTSQILADSTIQQYSSYGRIHTTAQTKNHFIVPQLLLQFGNRRFNKGSSTPVLFATANIHHEILQHLRAIFAMKYFRMELYAPHLFVLYLISSNRHLIRRSYFFEIGRDNRNCVSVTHPHLCIFLHVLEQHIVLVKRAQMCTSVFTTSGRFHLAAIGISDKLRTVTDPQNRIFPTNFTQICFKRTFIVYRERAARKNNPLYTFIPLWELIVR